MTQQHHQNHATWECKYHVVFIPKYRKKTIFGVIKKRLGAAARKQDRRRPSDARSRPHADFHSAEIFRGGGDRLHERKEFDLDRAERRAQGAQFHRAQVWARGYFVSTVGRDEEMIRAYIKNQEMQDRELDQLSMIP